MGGGADELDGSRHEVQLDHVDHVCAVGAVASGDFHILPSTQTVADAVHGKW